MRKKAFKILKSKFGIHVNKKELIPNLFFSVNYESLLTDFFAVEEIAYNDNLDFYITMLDNPNMPFKISFLDREIILTGSILKATNDTSDLRFTIFGNEGLLFRYVLAALERDYNIYSFHACSLFDEKTKQLYIIAGGAGSGKTCLILKGLELGLKLFSTEMTHFSFDNEFTLYKGSLVDNIRVGNLKYSYPLLINKLNLKLPNTNDEWSEKIAVDLVKEQTKFDLIEKADVIVILPHIEENRHESIVIDVKNRKVTKKALFDNISNKIGETVLLYDIMPINGFDDPILMKYRLIAIDNFLNNIDRVVKVIAGSQNCWKGIL